MRRPRFTIASLLIVVLFVAVGVAGLRAATELWDASLFGLALVTLLAAVLLAVHRAGRRRAYWLGFAIWGGAYLGASLVPAVADRLPTTKGLSYVESKRPGQSTVGKVLRLRGLGGSAADAVTEVAFSPNGAMLAVGSDRTVRLWDATTGRLLGAANNNAAEFVRIGHTLFALIFAALGGLLSRQLHDARRDDRPAAEPGGGG